MPSGSKSSPKIVPVALVIAAKGQRGAGPKAIPSAQKIKAALGKAVQGSPAAKAAFRRNPQAVKSVVRHIRSALRQQQAQTSKQKVTARGHAAQASRKGARPGKGPAKPLSPAKATKKAFAEAKRSSPAARAAFKAAAPAAKRAEKHVEALVRLQQQPKRNLLSSMAQGAQALHALRGVTKEMGKQERSTKSAKDILSEAKHASPASRAAFKAAAPAAKRAEKHIDALTGIMQKPKPNLFSALGQGFQAMRALRGVTQEMVKQQREASKGAKVDVAAAMRQASRSSPAAQAAFAKHGDAVTRATARLEAMVGHQQAPRPNLLGALVQGAKAMHALRGVTREMARESRTSPGSASVHIDLSGAGKAARGKASTPALSGFSVGTKASGKSGSVRVVAMQAHVIPLSGKAARQVSRLVQQALHPQGGRRTGRPARRKPAQQGAKQ